MIDTEFDLKITLKILNPDNHQVQLYSEKFTGRYFKVRDDDLSSKQGSLYTFKIILKKITQIFLAIYLHTFIFVIN